MVRRGAAAAADDVDQAVAGKLPDNAGHVLGRFVILAEFVGQAGIGIGAHQRVGDAAEIGDMGAHVLGAERAVEADAGRLGMAHRIPERFRHLAGQQTPGFVGDGAGDHHRHVDAALLADLGDRIQRRLGVQRVKNGFDQQDVGAAIEQAVDLLAIGDAQIIEGHGAIAGIGDVRRDRGGAVGGADRARDKARLAVFGLHGVGGAARQPCALAIELIGEFGQIVIGLRDRGRGEGVGGDDVGAGPQILGVNGFDRLRLGQDQQVVVAAQIAVKILEARAAERGLIEIEALDHGAHRTVQHQNTFAGEGGQSSALCGIGRGHIRQLSSRPSDGCRADG